MISRQDILDILEELRNEDNDKVAQEHIDMIHSLDDETLQNRLKEQGIESKEDVRNVVVQVLRSSTKFTNLNEFISYGIDKNTIHIHLVPEDVHNMLNSKGLKIAELELIDALEKIQSMIKTDKSFSHIENIYAVSDLIQKSVTRVFDNLAFDVKIMLDEQAKEDTELSKFYDRFKGNKYIGRALLSTNKLLSDEWNVLKETRKRTLKLDLENRFMESLQEGVKSDEQFCMSPTNSEPEKMKKISSNPQEI